MHGEQATSLVHRLCSALDCGRNEGAPGDNRLTLLPDPAFAMAPFAGPAERGAPSFSARRMGPLLVLVRSQRNQLAPLSALTQGFSK